MAVLSWLCCQSEVALMTITECDVMWIAALPRLYDSRSWLLYHQAKLNMIQISVEKTGGATEATKETRFHTASIS